MATKKTVLFISHDASRTGATIILINFLRWFKQNADIPFQVLICKRGELEDQFEALAPVWYLDTELGRRAAVRAALFRIALARPPNVLRFTALAARIDSSAKIGLIYSNTIANGRVLEALAPLSCPVLTHVHELEFAIRRFGGKDFESVKRHTNHFVAVSEAVRNNLMA